MHRLLPRCGSRLHHSALQSPPPWHHTCHMRTATSATLTLCVQLSHSAGPSVNATNAVGGGRAANRYVHACMLYMHATLDHRRHHHTWCSPIQPPTHMHAYTQGLLVHANQYKAWLRTQKRRFKKLCSTTPTSSRATSYLKHACLICIWMACPTLSYTSNTKPTPYTHTLLLSQALPAISNQQCPGMTEWPA